MTKEIKHRWWILAACGSIGLLLDWGTKFLAEQMLSRGQAVSIIGDYLEFVLVYNRGAIFGLDPRVLVPDFPVNIFFSVFTVIAIGVLIAYYHFLKKSEVVMHWGLALILPGALGNLLDRVIHPERGVVDFIKMGISQEVYWPIYNLADVYVTAGVGLIILSMILEEVRRKRAAASLGEETPEDSKSPHA